MGVVMIDGSTVPSFVEDETHFNKSINDHFSALDVNHDGTLSRSELRKAFESMRLIFDVAEPSPSQLSTLYDSIFDRFDVDRNGTVDLEEFRSEMRKIMLAIADGLGESPIQMVLEGGGNGGGDLLQQAADLEAQKIKESSKEK